jgi:hypothetical protein
MVSQNAELLFPNARFNSHMPFLRRDILLFCHAEDPLEHTFVQEGVIWDRLAHDSDLRKRFASVQRHRTMAFRRWKLQCARWQSRAFQPLPTGLPSESVECCPTFHEEGGKFHVSFIGGTPTARRFEYHLYQMSGPGLDALGSATKVSAIETSVGFVSQRYVCLGEGPILNLYDRMSQVRFRLVCPMRLLHAVTYRADDENCLIITGKTERAKLLVLVYHIDRDETGTIAVPADEEIYKPTVYANRVVFANRFNHEQERRALRHSFCETQPASVAVRRVAAT